jgi:hypothetical protein
MIAQLQILRLRLRMTFVRGMALVLGGDGSGAGFCCGFPWRKHFFGVLFVFVGDEQGFELADEVGGVHRLDEHFVGAVFLPFGIGEREGGEHGDSGPIGCFARGGDDFVAGGVAFHPHIGDDHVIGVGAHLQFCFFGGSGGFDLEAVDFKNCLESEQNGQFVVD